VLILKDPKTEITVHRDYLEIKTPLQSYIVAYIHIKTLYINKTIELNISQFYTISQKIDTYIIDRYGYILAKLQKIKENK
jgi:hypothetical protein